MAAFAVFAAADPSFAVAVSAAFAVFAAADPLFADKTEWSPAAQCLHGGK